MNPNGDRPRRPNPVRRPSARRPLFERVEPRLLLCAVHEPGGAGFDLSFWGNTLIGPSLSGGSSATTRPTQRTTIVGPPQPAPPRAATAPLAWATAANGMPILNSLPGAPTAVYLDFDGEGTMTGTNTPYNEDADPTTFNATEQANIVEAWRHVSAYFAIFNTNVTTVFSSLPKAWNLIGNGINNGYAYVNTFPNSSPLAFNNSSHARTRQSGLAHEIGHVFGLQHQSGYDNLGNKTAEYLGATDSLHGPIMGIDYAGTIHKWFVGHGSNSPGTLQDDITVIASKIKAREPAGGDGFRADDFGNTILTATSLTLDPSSGAQSASGIVERMTDVDAFSFAAPAGGGPVSISAVPELPSGLDARLEIYDAAGNRLATRDASTNDQHLTLALPDGTYYALVSGHGNYGDLGKYDLTVHALPAGWSAAGVGSTGDFGGYTRHDPVTNTFTNAGTGSSGIAGTADAFHFAYQQLTGDGQIVARITQNQNTGTPARAGLEIRESLAPNARHAAIVLNSAGRAELLSRITTGGGTGVSGGLAGAIPRWLKLTRSSSAVAGYVSADGITWTMVGQVSLGIGSTAYVGLLTTAGSSNKVNVAKFDAVAITGNTAPPATNALPAPTGLLVQRAATGTGLDVAWGAVPAATGYLLQRSTDGVTFETRATLGAAATTYADASPGASMRYFYRVLALDASGASAPSAAASAVNRPPAPATVSVINWKVDSLVVDWKDVSGDAGYRVERSTDGGATFAPLATVAANVPSFTDTGLAGATSYVYRVVTLVPGGGESAPSAPVTGATRLPAVTNVRFDGITPAGITLRWTDLANDAGYRVDRATSNVASSVWTTIGTVGASATSFTDTTAAPLGEYYYRVYGVNGQSLSLQQSNALYTAAPSASVPPSPWASQDIGPVYGGGAGATGYAASTGTFTLLTSAYDYSSISDGFRYTYQPLVGNGEITARVGSIEYANAASRLGVMIRASTAANAQNAAVVLTAGEGVHLQTRAAAGQNTTLTTVTGVAPPAWIRIKRELINPGTLTWAVSGYYSTNGTTWTQIGSTVNLTMSTNALIGLASAGRDTTRFVTTTATNVTVSNDAPTVATPAAASPNPLANSDKATLSVLGADDHGEANLTYAWTTTAAPAGVPSPTFAVNNSNAAKSALVTFFAPGQYQFTVTITDTSGRAVTSVVNVTVAASAFPAVTAAGFDALRSLTFTFNTDVGASLSPADLSVQPLPSGAPLTPNAVTWDAATRTATFSFAARLPDGNYRATLAAAGVSTPAGRTPAADAVHDFFALAGDLDRNRVVNFDDLLLLSSNYNQSDKAPSQGDLDGNRIVNFDDLLILASNYNKSLSAAAPATSPTAGLASPAATTDPTPADKAKPLATLFNTSVPVARPAPPTTKIVNKPAKRAK